MSRHITRPEKYEAAIKARIARERERAGVRLPEKDVVNVGDSPSKRSQIQRKRCLFCKRKGRLANWETMLSFQLRRRCLAWNWAGGSPMFPPNRPCCEHCFMVRRYELPYYPYLWDKWDFAFISGWD